MRLATAAATDAGESACAARNTFSQEEITSTVSTVPGSSGPWRITTARRGRVMPAGRTQIGLAIGQLAGQQPQFRRTARGGKRLPAVDLLQQRLPGGLGDALPRRGQALDQDGDHHVAAAADAVQQGFGALVGHGVQLRLPVGDRQRRIVAAQPPAPPPLRRRSGRRAMSNRSRAFMAAVSRTEPRGRSDFANPAATVREVADSPIRCGIVGIWARITRPLWESGVGLASDLEATADPRPRPETTEGSGKLSPCLPLSLLTVAI